MFKKTGTAQQVSVHDPKTGATLLTCAKCAKNTEAKLDKKAYLGGTSKQKCQHCGDNLEV